MAFFRTVPLKTKLIVALAIPLLVLAVFAALQVRRSAIEAREAQAQLDQVDQVVVFTEMTVILRNEFDAQLQFDTTEEQLTLVRDRTDNAFERLLTQGSEFGFESDELEAIRGVQASLENVRNILGDNPRATVVDAAEQITAGLSFAEPTSLMGAVTEFEALVGQTATLVQIDKDVLIDPTTALSLQSLRLALELDTSVRSEGLHYVLLSQFPSTAVNDQVVALQTSNRAESELLRQQLTAGGDDDSRVLLELLTSSDVWSEFQAIRSRVALVGPGESLAFDTQVVTETLGQVSDGLDTISEESINQLFATAFLRRADANQLQWLTIVASLAVLGLVSLVLFSFYRSIRRPIVSLTSRSLEIADIELPELVSLMRASGVDTEIPEIEPIERHTNDEIGELVTAFNGMHQTAVTLAAEQAGSRRTVGDMFVNLGRRNQKLLMRMLGELDALEEQEPDPERLDALYRVDRLATRMRRNAESLLVLAGAEAARRVGQPVPLSEVARSAVSEVERFDRVKISVQGDAAIDGAIVVDVAHLLAELVENALEASPEQSTVAVSVVSTRSRHRIAVSDEGLGMTGDQIEAANELIANAADSEESPSKQLGLFVVGRLAARHGITVRLLEHAGFGLAAVVELPPTAVVSDADVWSDGQQEQVTSPRVALGSPVLSTESSDATQSAPQPRPTTQPQPQPTVVPQPRALPQPEPAPKSQPIPQVAAANIQSTERADRVTEHAGATTNHIMRSRRSSERGTPRRRQNGDTLPPAGPIHTSSARKLRAAALTPAGAPKPSAPELSAPNTSGPEPSAPEPSAPNTSRAPEPSAPNTSSAPAPAPSPFSVRRQPGANLPTGVPDQASPQPPQATPTSSPNARSASSFANLGSFQKATVLATEHARQSTSAEESNQ